MVYQGSVGTSIYKNSDPSKYLVGFVYPSACCNAWANNGENIIAELTNSPWIKHYRSVCVEMSRGAQRYNEATNGIGLSSRSHCIIRTPYSCTVRQKVVSFFRDAFRRNSSGSGASWSSMLPNFSRNAHSYQEEPHRIHSRHSTSRWINRTKPATCHKACEIQRTMLNRQHILFSTKNSEERKFGRDNTVRQIQMTEATPSDQSNSQNSTPNPRPSALVLASADRSREGVAKKTRFSLHPSTCNAPPDLLRPRRDSEDTANSVSSLVDFSHRSDRPLTERTSICGDSTSPQGSKTNKSVIAGKVNILLTDMRVSEGESKIDQPAETYANHHKLLCGDKKRRATPAFVRERDKTNSSKYLTTKHSINKKQKVVINSPARRYFNNTSGLKRAFSVIGTPEERKKVTLESDSHQSLPSTPVLSDTPGTPAASPESPKELNYRCPTWNTPHMALEHAAHRSGADGQKTVGRLPRSGLTNFGNRPSPHITHSPGLSSVIYDYPQTQRNGPCSFRRYRKLISDLDQMHRNYAAPYEIAREMIDSVCLSRLNVLTQSLLASKPTSSPYERVNITADSNGDAGTQWKDKHDLDLQLIALQNVDNGTGPLRCKSVRLHRTHAALATKESASILCLPVRGARTSFNSENRTGKSKINREITRHVSMSSGTSFGRCGSSLAYQLNCDYDKYSVRSMTAGHQQTDRVTVATVREMTTRPITVRQQNQSTERGVQVDGNFGLTYNEVLAESVHTKEHKAVLICHGTQTTHSVLHGGEYADSGASDNSQPVRYFTAGEYSSLHTVMQSPLPIDAQTPRTPLSSSITEPIVVRNPMSPIQLDLAGATAHPYCTEPMWNHVDTQSFVNGPVVPELSVSTARTVLQEKRLCENHEIGNVQPNTVNFISYISQPVRPTTDHNALGNNRTRSSSPADSGSVAFMSTAKVIELTSPGQLEENSGPAPTPLLFRCHVTSVATQTELSEPYENHQMHVSFPEQWSVPSGVTCAVQFPNNCRKMSATAPQRRVAELAVQRICSRESDKAGSKTFARAVNDSGFTALTCADLDVSANAKNGGTTAAASNKSLAKMIRKCETVTSCNALLTTDSMRARNSRQCSAGTSHRSIRNHIFSTKNVKSNEIEGSPKEISKDSLSVMHSPLAELEKLSPGRECSSDYGCGISETQRIGPTHSVIGRALFPKALNYVNVGGREGRMSSCDFKSQKNVAFLTHRGRAHSIRRQKWTNGHPEKYDGDTSSSVSPPPHMRISSGTRSYCEPSGSITLATTARPRGSAHQPGCTYRINNEYSGVPLQRRIGKCYPPISTQTSGFYGLKRHSSIPQMARRPSSNTEDMSNTDAPCLTRPSSNPSLLLHRKVCQIGHTRPLNHDSSTLRHCPKRTTMTRGTKKMKRERSSLVVPHKCSRPGSSLSTGRSSVIVNPKYYDASQPDGIVFGMRLSSGGQKISHSKQRSPRKLRSPRSQHAHNSTRCTEDNLLRHTFASLQKVRKKTKSSVSVTSHPPMVFKR